MAPDLATVPCVSREAPPLDADEAVTALYVAHYRGLVRLAALLLDDVGAAEEVVQDAYVRMHGSWRRIRDPQAAVDQVAVRFVRSYVLDDSITARSLGAYRAGLRMQVDFGGRPMTRVYLVRFRVGDDAPYVVADAESDRIGIDAQPLPASGRFNLHGTTAGSSVAEVRLRTAGGTALDGVGTVIEVGSGWIVPVALAPGPRPVTAAAWTVDPDLSMAFAARPLG